MVQPLNFYDFTRLLMSTSTSNAVAIDPEFQRSISNLISALGGYDPVTKNYKLGDEALACLRDLKKWLQNYDGKYETYDVACVIANTTLVTNDLLDIVSQWDTVERKKKDEYQDKIAIACLELLVSLTWPVEVYGKEESSSYFMQCMILKEAQLRYRNSILTHGKHNILLAMLRLGMKCNLSAKSEERSDRDNGILTLVCMFFRNLLVISSNNDEDRRSIIQEFNRQKVLSFLVTIGSGIGSNFDRQDFLLLESLYFLLRGIDSKIVFGLRTSSNDPLTGNLNELLESEKKLSKGVFKSSRHSRFGTLIAMNEGGGVYSPISGQRGVVSIESGLKSLDESKRWHKPASNFKSEEAEATSYQAATAVHNDSETLKIISRFVKDFLDNCYNPTFGKILQNLEKQTKRTKKSNFIHYLYLTAWFLEAERNRCKSKKLEMDYKLVGVSLSDQAVFFVLDCLKKGFEPGEFKDADLCHASIVCCLQSLTTIREMAYSKNQDIRDISEGMRSRLFYEEQWLILFTRLPGSCKRKSLGYACDVALLTNCLLKMLEEYSKQHTYLFVKSKRGGNKASATRPSARDIESDYGVDEQNEMYREEANRVTTERRFNYERFVNKYINDRTIEFYERILSNYNDVDEEVILAVFSFFRRTFGKTPNKAMFYRMSLMNIILNFTEEIPQTSKLGRVCNEFLTYYVQKFAATVSELPSLNIHLSGNMTQDDAFYYDHSGKPKVKARSEIKHEFRLSEEAQKMDEERQFSIIMAAIIDLGKQDFIKAVYDKLQLAVINGLTSMQLFSDKDTLDSIHKDALKRLFLRSLGLTVNTMDSIIAIPMQMNEMKLITQLEWIDKYQNEVVDLDGKIAMDFITVVQQHKQSNPKSGKDRSDSTSHENLDEYEDEVTENTNPEDHDAQDISDKNKKKDNEHSQYDEPTEDNSGDSDKNDTVNSRKQIGRNNADDLDDYDASDNDVSSKSTMDERNVEVDSPDNPGNSSTKRNHGDAFQSKDNVDNVESNVIVRKKRSMDDDDDDSDNSS